MTAPSYALTPAFSVAIGPDALGAFSECSGLAAERETYPYAEGGQNGFVHTLLGRLRYPHVTLKGGVTDQTVLLDWILASNRADTNVTVTFHRPDGTVLRRFELMSAVPVRWTGPSGDAAANAIATESLEIAHQGLLR